MNKKIAICLLIYLLQSLSTYSESSESKGHFDLDEISRICKNIEKNSEFSNVLRRYTISCLSGESGNISPDSLLQLSNRPSFIKLGEILFSDSTLCKLSPKWYTQDYFSDYRNYYLTNCPDERVRYKIVDKLFRQGNINGLFAMWNNCDIKKLKHYTYIRNKALNDNDTYVLMVLVTILHNSKKYKELRYIENVIKNKNYNKDIIEYIDTIRRQDCISLDKFINFNEE